MHMTARPGEQRLTGRFEGDQLAVWRRGSGSWVGLNRFVGQVHGDESGAELVGRMRLRRIAIASYVLLILGAALMVGVAAGHAPTEFITSVLAGAAAAGIANVAIQARDRGLLLAALRDTVGSPPSSCGSVVRE